MNRKLSEAAIGIALLLTLLCNVQLYGQDVSARISSREAWVGSPIVLQIQISNAKKYSLPESFKIDGCDVRTAGTPSQSSQIMIINGRRSESRSVTMQYSITPRRAGKFEIPELTINVDGNKQTTRPIQFAATKSETGDLLFAEVEGDQDKVYVGQPLKQKLKLWVKPFADRDQQIKLSEGQMWQMISDQTSWGSFAQRLQELAENRQRPGGETVLRKDADGREREYYLYEINATAYPNKPGEIDASDLQIVVNYPQTLGRSRDPFDSFFGDSALGGRSMLQGMMGDDSFSSPFGRRLTVTSARPVVAEVSVDSTEVVAVPTANQPIDYRGAVGKYQIIAEADPKNVSAGDPITLRIGVVGDGPMELVQAPPLHEIDSLTSDFQITDQSLAGFVQNETKVFVTSIRPRDENVKQIPPIPFTFFDPIKEAYETVYTKPISIDVEKADALDMSSIVSDVAGTRETNAKGSSQNLPKLNLQNDFSASLAISREAKSFGWWWYFAVVPPFCWLAIAFGRILIAAPAGFSSLKSIKSQAIRKIGTVKETSDIADAMREFIAKRSKSDCPTYQYAIGKLREFSAYDIAAKCELLFEKLESAKPGVENLAPEQTLNILRKESLSLLDAIDDVFATARRRPSRNAGTKPRRRLKSGVNALMIGFVILCVPASGMAAEALSLAALQAILREANSTYQAAERLVESEPVKAKQMFANSAQRYQLLVDQGVRNDRLFLNLGNAWCRSDKTANAILNYRRSLWLNPDGSTVRENLSAIEKLRVVEGDQASLNANDAKANVGYVGWPNKLLTRLISFAGYKSVQIVFAISSVLFWLLLVIKTIRPRSSTLRWCVVPLVLAVVSGVGCYQFENPDVKLAVVMNDAIELRSGDGDEFQAAAKLDAAAGTVVHILDQRADWRNVRLPDGRVGWLPDSAIERVAM